MKHFFKFLSLFSFLILFSGCYTYQMSSWNDDDGIYVSSIRNYNYGQYFSDLANEIIEEYDNSAIVDSEDTDNLPWGYKPDQTQIFIDFYPRYVTPGCTTEADEVSRDYKKFKKQGIEVVGISKDDVDSHKNCCDKMKIPYILLSDIDKEVSKKLLTIIRKFTSS